jgi:hypothetical protein
MTRRRALTVQEVALAARVFGETLPYGRIFLSPWCGWHGRAFVLPTGVGRRSRYLIHVGPRGFADALRTPALQATLIHELTHVWQGQHQGWPWRYVCNSLWHQAVRGRRAYDYVLGQPWDTYAVEQQAQLVQDWFAAGERPDDPRALYVEHHLRCALARPGKERRRWSPFGHIR